MIELLLNGFVFPRAKGPIPEFIGLDTVFAIAGAGGVLGLVLASTLKRPPPEHDVWTRRGVVFGFWGGMLLYVLVLTVQLL